MPDVSCKEMAQKGFKNLYSVLQPGKIYGL
ncbi:hypothetical protein J3D56_003902 [Erwinia persicina]|jgi:hypothetical protein|nr:hypothetical protein [Erwinia persicina]